MRLATFLCTSPLQPPIFLSVPPFSKLSSQLGFIYLFIFGWLVFKNLFIYSSFKNFIVVQVQFSAFFPNPSPNPSPPHLPPVSTPLIIVHVSFIIVPTNPSPFSPETPSSPLWSLSASSQFQCLRFLTTI